MVDKFINIFEGLKRAHGCTYINSVPKNGVKFYMPKKSGHKLNKGDKITFMTGGGGGYGNPKNRKHSSIENDLKQEYLSVKYVEDNFKNYKFS